MFKLGECYEDDAKSIADHLRKAGIKVELKPSIDASIETEEFLQGKLSELKADITDKDVIEEYERYIDVLKKILGSNPSPGDFQEAYVKELLPPIGEAREKLKAMLESAESEEDSDKANGVQMGQIEGSEESAKWRDRAKDVISDTVKVIADGERAKRFIQFVISLNDIEIGRDIGSRLDDPIVAIPVDLDDYGIEHPRAKRVISVYLDKCYELYVDEFSTFYTDRLDDEFIRQYTDEHMKIASFSLLLNDLIENHSSEKMDFQTFENECVFVTDSKSRGLRVVGYGVAEEIAKVLEKNGMVKIKGDTIRWKK